MFQPAEVNSKKWLSICDPAFKTVDKRPGSRLLSGNCHENFSSVFRATIRICL